MTMATLNEKLEQWFVMVPGQWENGLSNTIELRDWWAVGNDGDGIIAYFGSEEAAFRFRLAEINRELNG